ncbi:MAG: hypothetical protein FJX51_09085 [Alphaproteobacteria bacterium]|nr:hypothetical protein [Alphaproteobacteria bacterium]
MPTAWRNVALLLLLGTLWGAQSPMIKEAVQTLSPGVAAAGRLATAGLVLLVIAYVRRPSMLAAMRMPAAWRAVAPIALFSYLIPTLFISYGQQHIDSGLTAIVLGSVPLFTAMFSFLVFRRERFEAWTGVGLIVGFVGIVLLTGPVAATPEDAVAVGLALVFTSALSYAFANMLMRRANAYDPVVSSVIVLILATAGLVPIALFDGTPMTAEPSTASILAVLGLGAFSTGWGSYIFFTLAGRVGPTLLSTVNYVTPVVGVALGAAWHAEVLETSAFAALGAILAGVAAVSFGRARAVKTSP